MTTVSELDELYTRRGELLDMKYSRSRLLLGRNGYYSSEDFKDLDAEIQEVTEQIEAFAVNEWIAGEERGKEQAASGLIEDADDYADLKATQESAQGRGW